MKSVQRRNAVRSAIMAAALALFPGWDPAAVAADKELLDILLSNEAITKEQYEDLLAKEETTKEDVDKVVVTLNEKGFRIKSADGAFHMKLGARLHAQASANVGNFSGGEDPKDGAELRRARIELSGGFYEDWSWVAEADFGDNEVAVKDFWLGYEPLPWMSVMVGHQKQPYSLSLEMSSNDIPFIERGIDNDLNVPFVDRAIGVRSNVFGDHWFVAAGVYGEGVAESDEDEGVGVVGRGVWAPIIEPNHVLHLGAHAAYRQATGSNNKVRVKSETTHMSSLNVTDTGKGVITDIDSTTLVGAEAAWAYGPLSCFGEYSQAFMDRGAGSNLSFNSWHVATALSLTGETMAAAYRIDAGEFKRLHPKENFSWAARTPGAWEVAARVAALYADDNDIQGGEETVLTTALNWYVNDAVRFMIEWSRIMDTDRSTQLRREAEGLNIFQFRAQYTF